MTKSKCYNKGKVPAEISAEELWNRAEKINNYPEYEDFLKQTFVPSPDFSKFVEHLIKEIDNRINDRLKWFTKAFPHATLAGKKMQVKEFEEFKQIILNSVEVVKDEKK